MSNNASETQTRLPEVPSDTAENNPLLRTSNLPLFSQLNAEKCVNGVGKLLIEYESGIHDLDQKLYDEGIERNVQNVILPLDRLSGPLDFAWGTFKLLYTVRRNQSIANSYIKLHPRIIKAKREKYFSSSLHRAFMELKEKQAELTEPVRRIIHKHLLESRLSGMDLSDNSYKHYQSLTDKLDEFRLSYRNKLYESTSSFKHHLEFKDVVNFPPEVLRLFAVDKTNISKGPWVLTLDSYMYQTFLQYCEDRLVRWNAWYAYNVRASAISGAELNNSLNVEEIRHYRKELAVLLGFKTFSDLSMTTKMAGSVENVKEMITTLHIKSKAITLKEIEDLQEYATKNKFPHKLELWDIPYWQRLHKDELFNIDDDVVCQYFPLPNVLNGIFQLFHKLFNVTIQEVKEEIDTWHEDVSYYQILDENGKQIASFFLDPYYRGTDKVKGSFMEIGRNRSDVIGWEPLSYLVFNFPAPAYGKPPLLSFEDLKMLLQRLGHLLQHSLTTIPYTEVSGLTNLEWDVVNVCPMVLNSFLKHYGTVAAISSHVDSGKIIPAEMHEHLLKRDNYMSGLKLTEELYLSELDLELYIRKDFWLSITKDVWQQYMPFPFEKHSAPPCSFPEIFSGQYPAAYFSNLWGKMIAADVFSAFEEAGLDNIENLQQISKRFRDTFLALGGGCHPGEIFRKFRGRDPSTDALLAHLGLTNNKIHITI